jgi:acyl-CoA thioester hydrolase
VARTTDVALPASRFELTVRYAETDAQGIVHHAGYLVWFEEGRSDFLRRRGIPYSELERAGYFVVVAGAELRYRAPAFYEDRLTVETTLLRARGKLLEFGYRVLRGELLLAEGATRHVVVDRDRRPVLLPPGFLAPLFRTASDR